VSAGAGWASETVRFARLSLGRPAGAAGAGAGDDGVLASGVAVGDAASGRILVRHWLSVSAAVGCLSTAGRSGRPSAGWNSRRGPRLSSRPSPQAGDCLAPPWKLGCLPSLAMAFGAGAAEGDSGPLRSQLPKSRTFPSSAKGGGPLRLPPRSLPASEPAAPKPPPRSRSPNPPRSDVRRWPGRSGRGPFRVQSVISLASGRSLAAMVSAWESARLKQCTYGVRQR
jgi:hypothetical protein